jgi:hypothetical protein
MSKTASGAKVRCVAHTLAEQLRAIHTVELAALRVRQKHDLQDVEKMLEADMAWSAQYARLAMPIGGAD